MDLTVTEEDEEMETSLDNITAVQGSDGHLIIHEILEGEVLEELDKGHREVEKGEASQGHFGA